jgi:hypothetical protein
MMMKKTESKKGLLKRMKEQQIKLQRFELEQEIKECSDEVVEIIYHCVAHGLIADKNFDVRYYISECRVLMEEALLPDYFLSDLLDEAETKGLLAAALPLSDSLVDILSGAAQVYPSANPRLIFKIGQLHQLFKQIEKLTN